MCASIQVLQDLVECSFSFPFFNVGKATLRRSMLPHVKVENAINLACVIATLLHIYTQSCTVLCVWARCKTEIDNMTNNVIC